MAVTVLDPKTALLVIDMQKAIVSLPTVHPVDQVIQRASELTSAFRKRSLPVVLVCVAGFPPGRTDGGRSQLQFSDGGTDFVPDLNQQPQDHTIMKRQWGAFTNTDLEAYLRQHEVTQVVIAGIATSIGVESTARQAYELGFNVTLAIDAMSDRNLDAHFNSTTRIFPRLGESGTTAQIINLLRPNA